MLRLGTGQQSRSLLVSFVRACLPSEPWLARYSQKHLGLPKKLHLTTRASRSTRVTTYGLTTTKTASCQDQGSISKSRLSGSCILTMCKSSRTLQIFNWCLWRPGYQREVNRQHRLGQYRIWLICRQSARQTERNERMRPRVLPNKTQARPTKKIDGHNSMLLGKAARFYLLLVRFPVAFTFLCVPIGSC